MSDHIQYWPFDPNNYEKWLQFRSMFEGFGGSEIGTLFNEGTKVVNRFQSRRGLFYSKLGLFKTNVVTANTYSGHVMEPVIAENWFPYWDPDHPGTDKLIENIVNKRRVRESVEVHAIVTNDKYPYVFANIDRKFEWKKDDWILEIKNSLSHALSRYIGGFPPSYVLQIMNYLMILEFRFGALGTLKDGRFYEEIPIEFDKVIGDQIAAKSEEAWLVILAAKEAIEGVVNENERNKILEEFEPDIDGSDADSEFLKERYRNNGESQVIATREVLEAGVSYRQRVNQMSTMTKDKDYYANILKDYLGKNDASEILIGENCKITYWPNKKGTKVLRVPEKIFDYQ